MRCDIADREKLTELTVEEVAEACGLSASEVRHFAESGHLAYCLDIWPDQMAILDADLFHWLAAPEGTGAVADPVAAVARIRAVLSTGKAA